MGAVKTIRFRQLIRDHVAEIYAAAAVLGVFALSDPSDRVGFATGAVVASLAWLVAIARENSGDPPQDFLHTP